MSLNIENYSLYQYKPLKSKNTIRLLSLTPANSFNDPIDCRLKEFELELPATSLKPFAALSYVWGSPVGDQPITCDGKRLLVTMNCLLALKRLRGPRKGVDLWID